MALADTNIQNSAIELHYWFIDESHTMDALVENKCGLELLKFINAIAIELGEEITIETGPLGEGGLRRWLGLSKKGKGLVISTTVISAIATTLIVTPLGSGMTKVAENIVERMFEDKEEKEIEKKGKQLDNEKKQAEIDNIKADTKLKIQQVYKKPTVTKRRSNFYEGLAKYPKLQKVSFTVQDEKKKNISVEISVNKNEFKSFILVSDELEPVQVENAIIEIVSPVLKKGNYKWRGIYNGETLSFNMNSNNFKTLVQDGTIEFKNGTTIRCTIEIKRKLNSDGEEENTDYSILNVDEYFDNDKAVKVAGNKKFKKKNERGGQLGLFNPE